MSPLLLVTANFFVLIICLVGVQSCYFRGNWKWFWLMLICVLLSAGCIAAICYPWLMPAEPGSQLSLRPLNPL